MLLALAIIMFSFGGLELVGITAAEAAEPKTVIPKAINQVVYRILIFYIGALTVLLALYPWDALLQTLGSAGDPYSGRSEEHTSELQSLLRISYAVFCLKKKKNTKTDNIYN